MAQQTAMEQLIEWIDSDCTPMDCVMKAKELLKVEKEQMKQAMLSQVSPDREDSRHPLKPIFEKQFEQYYNETYNK